MPGSVIITSNSNVLSCRLARYDASLSLNDTSGKLALKLVPHCRMQRDYSAADQRAFLQMLAYLAEPILAAYRRGGGRGARLEWVVGLCARLFLPGVRGSQPWYRLYASATRGWCWGTNTSQFAGCAPI